MWPADDRDRYRRGEVAPLGPRKAPIFILAPLDMPRVGTVPAMGLPSH